MVVDVVVIVVASPSAPFLGAAILIDMRFVIPIEIVVVIAVR